MGAALGARQMRAAGARRGPRRRASGTAARLGSARGPKWGRGGGVGGKRKEERRGREEREKEKGGIVATLTCDAVSTAHV